MNNLFFFQNSYEGGKEKGLFEGYGKATYIGGHSYAVRKSASLQKNNLSHFLIIIGRLEWWYDEWSRTI